MKVQISLMICFGKLIKKYGVLYVSDSDYLGGMLAMLGVFYLAIIANIWLCVEVYFGKAADEKYLYLFLLPILINSYFLINSINFSEIILKNLDLKNLKEEIKCFFIFFSPVVSFFSLAILRSMASGGRL
jgi:hypothetical protein